MSLRILLADDSMTAQNMGKKILTDGGYDVVTVSNGAAAMKKLAEFTPDVIIADVYMPGYNGLEICEKVKKAAATASVPVLLSVGKLEPFRPEDGLKVHADGIIIKPFEATDLLAVTAKLAERAGKTAAPAAAPEPPARVAVEETPVAEPEAMAPEPVAAAEPAADMPAFAMEEPAAEAAPAYNFAPASSEPAPPSAFSLDSHQPDYVREFGLDPHDAPTTGFNYANAYAPEPEPTPFPVPESSFVAQLPEFQAAVDHVDSEEPAPLAPASLNLAVNAVEFSAPAPEVEAVSEIQDKPVAPVAAPASEDDFEAKLAAAMAAYEAPVGEVAAPVASVESYDAVSAYEAVAPAAYSQVTVPPTWVAEEAPLTETEMGLSLEEELRAFSAAAGATATAPVVSTGFAAPAGPLGDTSFDDEVADLVEQSKNSFFPSAEPNLATALEPVITEPAADLSTLTERVNAVMDDAGFATSLDTTIGPATNALLATEPVALTSFETTHDTEPELTPEPSLEENTTELAQFDSVPAADTDIPELLTHDIPTDWTAASAAVEESAVSSDAIEPDTFDAPVASIPAPQPETSDDLLLTHDDFVSPEAPFAHAAIDEVAHDNTLGASLPVEHAEPAETMTQPSALTPIVETDARNEVINHAMTEIEHTAPALDETAISQVVERVMDRMKDDIVAQIVKELAAKLGK